MESGSPFGERLHPSKRSSMTRRSFFLFEDLLTRTACSHGICKFRWPRATATNDTSDTLEKCFAARQTAPETTAERGRSVRSINLSFRISSLDVALTNQLEPSTHESDLFLSFHQGKRTRCIDCILIKETLLDLHVETFSSIRFSFVFFL